ncbi:hypothetical protein C8R43DRAFT_991278 [Mycena crocata]|nr:hypothetical protein C8R43DRAFT_991278 [Mycena crocata]
MSASTRLTHTLPPSESLPAWFALATIHLIISTSASFPAALVILRSMEADDPISFILRVTVICNLVVVGVTESIYVLRRQSDPVD